MKNYKAGLFYEKIETMEEAMKYFETYADQFDVEECYKLGVQYDNENTGYRSMGILRSSAKRGHAESQGRLASLYCGYHGGEDYYDYEMYKWFEKAALQGHPNSQFILACYYSETIKNEEIDSDKFLKASNWFKMLADKGHPFSQFMMGRINRKEGRNEEALKWYKLSAEQEYYEAQELLQTGYELGLVGFEKNEKESKKWGERLEIALKNRQGHGLQYWGMFAV